MKKFIASIQIMPHDALLDPQGKAVTAAMKNIGLPDVAAVRVGKNIACEISAPDDSSARQMVTLACERLLCNQIMERFEFHVAEVKDL